MENNMNAPYYNMLSFYHSGDGIEMSVVGTNQERLMKGEMLHNFEIWVSIEQTLDLDVGPLLWKAIFGSPMPCWWTNEQVRTCVKAFYLDCFEPLEGDKPMVCSKQNWETHKIRWVEIFENKEATFTPYCW